MSADRVERIRTRLNQAMAPDALEVIDESHLHVGHAGARDGLGHFRIRICSRELQGVGRLAAHRRIYQALDDMMETDIHALAIEVDSRNER